MRESYLEIHPDSVSSRAPRVVSLVTVTRRGLWMPVPGLSPGRFAHRSFKTTPSRRPYLFALSSALPRRSKHGTEDKLDRSGIKLDHTIWMGWSSMP